MCACYGGRMQNAPISQNIIISNYRANDIWMYGCIYDWPICSHCTRPLLNALLSYTLSARRVLLPLRCLGVNYIIAQCCGIGETCEIALHAWNECRKVLPIRNPLRTCRKVWRFAYAVLTKPTRIHTPTRTNIFRFCHCHRCHLCRGCCQTCSSAQRRHPFVQLCNFALEHPASARGRSSALVAYALMPELRINAQHLYLHRIEMPHILAAHLLFESTNTLYVVIISILVSLTELFSSCCVCEMCVFWHGYDCDRHRLMFGAVTFTVTIGCHDLCDSRRTTTAAHWRWFDRSSVTTVRVGRHRRAKTVLTE